MLAMVLAVVLAVVHNVAADHSVLIKFLTEAWVLVMVVDGRSVHQIMAAAATRKTTVGAHALTLSLPTLAPSSRLSRTSSTTTDHKNRDRDINKIRD